KIQMLHKLGPGMSLVDTPGMLWPDVAQEAALKLAAAHSIGRAAYDDEDVAMDLGRILLERYAHLLAARFGELPDGCDAHGLLGPRPGRRRAEVPASVTRVARVKSARLEHERGMCGS